MKRNLYFFLYPIRRSLWAWHLEQLRAYWTSFNGRKIVMISVDGRTEPASVVRRKLAGLGAECIEVPNDAWKWETPSFLSGLRLLRSLRDDELTFYAHAKGVTRTGADRRAMQSWCAAMYALNLSDPDLIGRLASRFDAIGCFRQRTKHGGSAWHFSGTYFWFKHAAVFSRRWRDIHDGRYGVEGYLGRHLPFHASYSLTPYRHFSRLYRDGVSADERRSWLRRLKTAGRPPRMSSRARIGCAASPGGRQARDNQNIEAGCDSGAAPALSSQTPR